MASNYTENYGLCQWEETDAVLRTDFNEDNAKIDEALKNQKNNISSLSSKLANKASNASLNELSAAVSLKANKTALDAAINRISALESGKADQSDLEQVEDDIDALEGSKANKSDLAWVKISEQTLSSAAASVSISLNTSGYRRLKLYFETEGAEAINGSFNGNPTVYYPSTEFGTTFPVVKSADQYVGGYIELFPVGTGRMVGGKLSCTSMFRASGENVVSNHITHIICPELAFSALKTLVLTASDAGSGSTFVKNSRFSLYGLKE